MNSNQFKKYRVLFIRSSCPHCRLYCKFIERLNANLPIEKRIRIVDAEMTKYKIVENQLISLFDKSLDGFPCLFIDGIKKSGINSTYEARAWLESYLNSDFVITEENNLMFNKECEYKKTLFGRRLICK